ncbi:MAG: hypothetical protein KGO53_07885 [Alphaproteobacteria bacterium]|nr:hypothetical protein [Alphaproteobacteria bacterium]
MSFLRNVVMLGLGLLVVKTVQRAIENAEAQRVKVKAKADDVAAKMPKLKLDPVTGVYRPEA